MRNPHPERVAVAMSGGVDSSVAAALLREAGHEVVGFTLRLGSASGDWEATRACCGLAELHDARRVADALDLPHYVVDHSEQFEAFVIDDFVREYARGRTPNPCLRCNQHIKFETFLHQARALGCDAVATGHYARAGYDEASGRWCLGRGLDPGKDQSYVLYPLSQEQLGASRFPLGALHKAEVRERAAALGLVTADKPDSQELCFVADGQHAEFVAARAPEAAQPGDIVDPAGRRLGRHAGLAHYTVGQRKGLGLSSAEPLFVSELRAEGNLVVVEPAEAAKRRRLVLDELHWVSRAPTAEPWRCLVQVRYRMAPVACRLEPAGASAVLDTPLRGIAPGQAAVFYNEAGDVLAGGTIAAAYRDEG